MIHSVHAYVNKGTRKASTKIETIVFAKTSKQAENMIIDIVKSMGLYIENITVATSNQSIEQIRTTRPELSYRTPEQGYIYNEFAIKDSLRKYKR